MSYRNIDRHGLKNLAKEAPKVLDRMKIPPFVLLTLGTLSFLILVMIV